MHMSLYSTARFNSTVNVNKYQVHLSVTLMTFKEPVALYLIILFYFLKLTFT